MATKNKVEEISADKKMRIKRNAWSAWLFVIAVSFAIVLISIYTSTPEESQPGTPVPVIKKIADFISNEVADDQLVNVEPLPEKKVSKFGIAAGGGLTYLNSTELNAYFESLRDLGVGWVRWDVDWSVIEGKGKQNFDWSGPDRVVAAANKYGINSLAIIAYAPDWAARKGCVQGRQCAPADAGTFAFFSGLVVTRYKDSIRHWEIWNEPNTTGFWSPKPDPAAYSEILKESYLKIKSIDPTAFVISGGLAPSYDKKNGDISPITFVNRLYGLGSEKYFDAIGLHPYSFPALPENKIYWNSWQQMNSIRKTMNVNGDTDKKIWITEYGAPTGGPGAKKNQNQLKFIEDFDYMTESAQEKILSGAILSYQERGDWFGPFFWYSLKDLGTTKDTLENFFGLLRYDGSRKPAYMTFQKLIQSQSGK